MNVIKSERITMVDVDDTLVLWNQSEYPPEKRIEVKCHGYTSYVVPHEKNLKLLRKFAKLGYTIIVWSQSGWEWAEAVCRALDLGDIVHSVTSKPRYYFDDIPCQEWMGVRIWRDPRTGTEAKTPQGASEKGSGTS